jgi:hypothetical protein
MTAKLSYDFSTNQKTLFAIYISYLFDNGATSTTIIFNNCHFGKDVCLSCHSYHALNANEIKDIQKAICSAIDAELISNRNYNKYFHQNALRKSLQWIKDQLTIETLTKFITDNEYVHIPVFNYDYYNGAIKIPLAHVQDFIVVKSTWKYCCPDCDTTGEITTDKDDKISHEIKCTKCGCDFKIIN